MVKVNFDKWNKEEYSVTIEGHAGVSTICSAVSALAYALINTLESYKTVYGNKAFMLSHNVVEGDNVYYSCAVGCISKEYQQVVSAVVETVYIGLKGIQESYPDNVTIEVNE